MLPLTDVLMFGPGVAEPEAAMLMTSVEIAPGPVVIAAEAAAVSMFVWAALVGAGAVALNIATLPKVVFTAINDSTPPVLFVVSVIDDAPLENLPS